MRAKSRANTRWNAAAQIATALSQLVVTLALVRLLKPEAFGEVAMVYLTAGLVAILDEGGLSTSIVAADERCCEILNRVFWQEVVVGCCFVAGLWLIAGLLAALTDSAEFMLYVALLAPMFIVTAPRRYAQTLLFRDNRFGGMSIARIAGAIVFVACTVFSAGLGYGVLSLVYGLMARMTVETVGFVLAAWGNLAVRAPSIDKFGSGYGRRGTVKVGERVLSYGADRIDLLLIGLLLGSTALGVYDVFKRTLIGLYQQVIPAFSRLALPRLTRLSGRPFVLAKAYALQVRYICLLLFPAYLFQAAFAEDLIGVVFGEGWRGYEAVFAWISLLLLVRSTNGPLDALLMARGWVRRELAYSVVALGAVAGALLYTIGDGLEAAVVSVTLVQTAMCVPVYWWLIRPAGYVGRKAYLKAIGVPLVLAASAVALAYVTVQGRWSHSEQAVRLGVALMTTLITFCTMCFMTYRGTRQWASAVLRRNRYG